MTPNDNTVAYPGREGAHSAAACDRLFPAARLVPQPSFVDVVEAVSARDATYGVLPIESSLAGPVNETHDLLYDSALSIVAEAILPIHHALVGPAAIPLEDVREIRSHPVALDQCRKLLASMPWATAVVAATTGDAAAAVAELGEPSVVGDRERACRADARPRDRRGRRRGSRGLYPLRRARAVHPARPPSRRVADGAHVRDTPPARAPSITRSSRSHVAGSTWCSSSRGRSRRGRSTTASTASSAATRSTTRSPAALAEMQVETARLRVFGSYRADRDEGWQTVAA